MMRMQKVGAPIVLVLFLLCLPLHLLSFEVSTMHHAMHGATHHHTEPAPEPVTSIFSHFEDMTSAPWVALLVLFVVAYVVTLFRVQEPRALVVFVRYILRHAYDHFDTGDIKQWIARHVISPPYSV